MNDSSYTKTIGSVPYSSSSSVPASERAFKREANSSNTNDSNIRIEQSLLIDNAVEDEDPSYVKLKFDSKDTDKKFEQNFDDYNLKDLKILNEMFDQQDETKGYILIKIILNCLLENYIYYFIVEKLILFQLPENLQLQDLEEGHIGKIKIRRSGRIELCIDDKKYLNVALSVSGPFLQVNI